MSIEAMKQALEALEFYYDQHGEEKDGQAIKALRQAIEQAEQAQPIGYIVHRAMAEPELKWQKPKDYLSVEPLYTAPPQRKPLTDEMRKQMKERCDSMEMRGAFADGWLSAEAAHGIKGEA